MRTRSSRFFVILVHLLGVSNHHLPSWYYDLLTSTSPSDRASFYTGIRGVHPHSMELERLDLKDVGGLDGVEWLFLQQQHDKHEESTSSTRKREKLRQQQQEGVASTTMRTTREPFWLQDSSDGKCLGPSGGFSECGDATLWFILKRGTQRKSLRMGPFGIEESLEQVNPEEPYRYALQIVDNDYEQQPQGTSRKSEEERDLPLPTFAWRQRRERRQQRDCLVPSGNRQKHKDTRLSASSSSPLELGPCVRHAAAWSWRVDDAGVLYLPKDVTKNNQRECLQRTKSSSAVLSSCQNYTQATDVRGQSSPHQEQQQQQRLVQFSLVRYHATSSPKLSSTKLSSPAHFKARPMIQESVDRPQDQVMDREAGGSEGLPSNVDKAHSHASGRVGPSPLFEMNLAGRPLLTSIPTREARKASDRSPFAALKDTNPILFLGAENGNNNRNKQPRRRKQSTGKNQVPLGGIHPSRNSMGKSAPMNPQSPGKLRKIEMNPYIAASSNEMWVDPQTGLEYHTDLCGYLGHDRKDYGRHTLVGVGLFTKTMLKIKVSLMTD